MPEVGSRDILILPATPPLPPTLSPFTGLVAVKTWRTCVHSTPHTRTVGGSTCAFFSDCCYTHVEAQHAVNLLHIRASSEYVHFMKSATAMLTCYVHTVATDNVHHGKEQIIPQTMHILITCMEKWLSLPVLYKSTPQRDFFFLFFYLSVQRWVSLQQSNIDL